MSWNRETSVKRRHWDEPIAGTEKREYTKC